MNLSKPRPTSTETWVSANMPFYTIPTELQTQLLTTIRFFLDIESCSLLWNLLLPQSTTTTNHTPPNQLMAPRKRDLNDFYLPLWKKTQPRKPAALMFSCPSSKTPSKVRILTEGSAPPLLVA
jgi:hypothetical protein